MGRCDVRSEYASRLAGYPSKMGDAALHLDLFERPGEKRIFQHPPRGVGRGRRGRAHREASRIRWTSSAEGSMRSPGTYSQSTITPVPRRGSSLVVPTQTPMVDW